MILLSTQLTLHFWESHEIPFALCPGVYVITNPYIVCLLNVSCLCTIFFFIVKTLGLGVFTTLLDSLICLRTYLSHFNFLSSCPHSSLSSYSKKLPMVPSFNYLKIFSGLIKYKLTSMIFQSFYWSLVFLHSFDTIFPVIPLCSSPSFLNTLYS